MKDTATLVGEYAAKKAEANRHYKELKELEVELIAALRENYPEDWSRWERGIQTFKAEGISINVDRSKRWIPEQVQAIIGEEQPGAVYEEVKLKVNGKLLNSLMKDAAYAKRLEPAMNTITPSLKLG